MKTRELIDLELIDDNPWVQLLRSYVVWRVALFGSDSHFN